MLDELVHIGVHVGIVAAQRLGHGVDGHGARALDAAQYLQALSPSLSLGSATPNEINKLEQLSGEQALPLGVTSAVHLATSLRAAAPPASAPSASTSPAAAPPAPAADRPAGSLTLPPAAAAASGANVLAIIATRRSVRRFAPTPLSLDALAGALAGMTAARSPPLLSAAVQVYGKRLAMAP